MRYMFLAVLAGPALAQSAPEGPAQAVIAQQIEAFQADDFATAFGFASPMIQGMFGSPERFGAMVKGGYPMVWRPGEVTFLRAEPFGAGLQQMVMSKDEGGRLHFLRYEMIETTRGWLINGVQFVGTQQGA